MKQRRRLNRELARRVQFAANWHRTKRKLARLHARIAAVRTDALPKLADTVFVCPARGFTDDRDFHAADN